MESIYIDHPENQTVNSVFDILMNSRLINQVNNREQIYNDQ